MFVRALLLLLVVASQAFAQSPQPEHRPASTPYSGDLSIFEEPGRDQKLHIDRVMDSLGIAPGRSVADIGAGSGWFTVRAARRVTKSGRVFAVDINPQAVQYVTKRAAKEKLTNITAIESKPDNPLLPPASVDAALLLKTYHEVQEPVTLLKNLRPALRPGAKIGVIDRNGDASSHGVNQQTVISELEQAGYRLESRYDFVKEDGMDYFLIFAVSPN
jgi:ubiquinone/menaquinone biosynthesis C-methylase UbiE